MATGDLDNVGRMPWWVPVVCLSVAAVEPITHFWIMYGLPEGAVPTGLHAGDSHMYLTSMQAPGNDWYSPYHMHSAPANDWRYFAVPAHQLYAILGRFADVLRINHFVALGVFNGLSTFAYLMAAFFFLRTVAPRIANLAFVLFAYGGGIGGAIYVLARVMGVATDPSFETVFARHAEYSLVEGAHLWPLLHASRLYYTLPLALGLAALMFAVRFAKTGHVLSIVWASLLLLCAQFLNMRVGTFLFGMGVVCIFFLPRPAMNRARTIAILAVPTILGAMLTMMAMRQHPAYSANVYGAIGETILFSSLMSAIILHLAIGWREILRNFRAQQGWMRIAVGAGAGYLASWMLLYAAYQIYFGNYWMWIDVTSAIRISDRAIIGVAMGTAFACYTKPSIDHDGKLDDVRWAAVCLLGIVIVGISAWGQGWFMSFLPRRLLVVLALPLCILTASAIARMAADRPVRAWAALSMLLACGLCTSAVGAIYFQGPRGHVPGQGAFARIHYESMTPHDAELLEQLPNERTLAPMFNPYTFGDVIALRGNPVVAAVGTLNHSSRDFNEIKEKIDTFFSTAPTNEWRTQFMQDEHVQIVYCPDTCPVDEAVIAQLDDHPMLDRIAAAGRGVIYRVDGKVSKL